MTLPTAERDGAGHLFRGMARPHSEAVRLGVIDERVRALVAAFNVDGVMETVASCEGHEFFWQYSSPYVAFRAPMYVAAGIERLLLKECLSSHPRLNYYWSIEGRFNIEVELVFRLTIPSLSYNCRFNRTRLDSDFEVLAIVVKEALEYVPHEEAQASDVRLHTPSSLHIARSRQEGA